MGNGTAAFTGISPSTSGFVLTSNGIGASPTFGLVSLTSSVTGTLPVANGGTGTTTSTGTGSVVLSTSPVLVTPTLGAASATSLTLSSALAVIYGGTGTTTSTGSGSVVLSTSPVLVTPTLGAATGTSLQLSGLTASQAVATDASKNLISVATTGTGNYVLSASPTLTGTLNFAAASGTSLTLSTALSPANGGTGQTSLTAVTVGTATNIENGTANYVVYQSASSTTGFISPTANVGYALISNGLGTAPSFQAIATTNISGGTANYLVYQTAASTTGFISPTANTGYILTSNGLASSPTFQALSVDLTSDVTGTLPVANGGTGSTSITQYQILMGNNTNAFTGITPSTSGFEKISLALSGFTLPP